MTTIDRIRLWQRQMAELVEPAVARSRTIGEIAIARGAMAQAPAFFRRHHRDRPLLLIADDNTDKAAGRRLAAILAADGLAVDRYVLSGTPRLKPTADLAEALKAPIAESRAIPVAVGSGVINDLVKYAAHGLGVDYSCVATAASMDGYSSAGSPLSVDGFKKTIACRPPVAIMADLDVIADAPAEMAGWGYGDLAGKAPAGGDWMIADALGIEPIDTVAWPLVQDNLQRWMADPDGIRHGTADAIAELFIGLTISGLAMEFYGSSRPASGADHQIAHLWEMEDLRHQGERVSHGACVAVGALTVLGLYDWLIARGITTEILARARAVAPRLEAKKAAIACWFGSGEVARKAEVETAAKHVEGDALAARLDRFAAAWPQLSRRLADRLPRREAMAAMLGRAGAPVQPEAIGVDRDHLRRTVLAARFLRRRYTILDTLDELGLLDEAVDAATG